MESKRKSKNQMMRICTITCVAYVLSIVLVRCSVAQSEGDLKELDQEIAGFVMEKALGHLYALDSNTEVDSLLTTAKGRIWLAICREPVPLNEPVATLIDELEQRVNGPQVPVRVLERAVEIACIISKKQSVENQKINFAFESHLLQSILLDPTSLEAWALLSSSFQLPIGRLAAKSWEELSQDNSMPCYVNAVLALRETPSDLEEFWDSVKRGNLRPECARVDIPWPTEFILRTPKDLKDSEDSDIPVTPSMFRFMVTETLIVNPATAPTLANPQSMIALSSIGYRIEESSELQELLAGAKFTTHLCHSNQWTYGLEAYGRFGRKIFIKLEQVSQQSEPAGSLEQIKQDRERCWRVAEELRGMAKDFIENFRHSPPLNEQLLDLEAKRIMNIIMKD